MYEPLLSHVKSKVHFFEMLLSVTVPLQNERLTLAAVLAPHCLSHQPREPDVPGRPADLVCRFTVLPRMTFAILTTEMALLKGGSRDE